MLNKVLQHLNKKFHCFSTTGLVLIKLIILAYDELYTYSVQITHISVSFHETEEVYSLMVICTEMQVELEQITQRRTVTKLT